MRRYLLLGLLTLTTSCDETQEYTIPSHLMGPTVAVFNVPFGIEKGNDAYEIDATGTTFFRGPFQPGPVVIHRRLAGNELVRVPEHEVHGFTASLYLACDSAGTDIEGTRTVVFSLGSVADQPHWKKQLERARLAALAEAFDRLHRRQAARCVRDEVAAVK